VNINKTLAAREKTYGDYEKVALISQVIKDILREGDQYIYLRAYQLESLDMIANKLARIVNGDPKYHDSWHDIQGYAKIVADKLK
jgi:Domain of unknown function (DUF6378)